MPSCTKESHDRSAGSNSPARFVYGELTVVVHTWTSGAENEVGGTQAWCRAYLIPGEAARKRRCIMYKGPRRKVKRKRITICGEER